MPDVTIEQALAIALQHHQAGQLSQAEPIYRQILAQVPQHAGALHLLGTIAIQVGRNDLGVDLIGKSIAIDSQNADAQSNLSNALRNLGQVDQAIDAARAALHINPQFAAAYFNLANAAGQTEETWTMPSRLSARQSRFNRTTPRPIATWGSCSANRDSSKRPLPLVKPRSE